MNKIQKPILTKNNYWLVTRHSDCVLLLDDEHSSRNYSKWLSTESDKQPAGWTDSIHFKEIVRAETGQTARYGYPLLDDPERGETIKPFMHLVNQQQINNMKEYVQLLVRDIIKDNLNNPDFDLIKDFVEVISVEVLSRFIDLPEIYKVKEKFSSVVGTAFYYHTQYEWIQPYSKEQQEEYKEARAFIDALFFEIAMVRFDKDGDDIISQTLKAYDNDYVRACAQTLQFTIGNHGMILALTHVLNQLVSYGSFQDDLRDLGTISPNNVDEILRVSCHHPYFYRILKHDIVIDGVKMDAGMIMMFDYESALHDPQVYPDPNNHDFNRTSINPNLAFGYGGHTCVGRVMSRIIISSIIEELLNNTTRIDLNGEVVSKRRGTEVITSLPAILRG